MGTAILFDNIWRNSLIISTILAVAYAAPYSKYGRGCGDIGCLPSEVCIMQHESCSYGQRENKDCGSYPACKKSGATPPQGVDYNVPNVVQRPTTTTRRPLPTLPAYGGNDYNRGGGGAGGYTPPDYNRGGGGSAGGYTPPDYNRGGGGYNPPDNRGGGYTPPGYNDGDDYYGGTTKKPKGSGIFSNFQDILGDEIGKYFKNQLINQITGGGGGGGTNSRVGGTNQGGGSSLSSLFGSGGSNPLSGILGGSGSGGGGGSSLSSLFGSGGSGGSGGLSSLFGGGGGSGGGLQSRGFAGLFNENPSAGKPTPPSA